MSLMWYKIMKELHNLDLELMACYQENTNFLYQTIPHIRKKGSNKV